MPGEEEVTRGKQFIQSLLPKYDNNPKDKKLDIHEARKAIEFLLEKKIKEAKDGKEIDEFVEHHSSKVAVGLRAVKSLSEEEVKDEEEDFKISVESLLGALEEIKKSITSRTKEPPQNIRNPSGGNATNKPEGSGSTRTTARVPHAPVNGSSTTITPKIKPSIPMDAAEGLNNIIGKISSCIKKFEAPKSSDFDKTEYKKYLEISRELNPLLDDYTDLMYNGSITSSKLFYLAINFSTKLKAAADKLETPEREDEISDEEKTPEEKIKEGLGRTSNEIRELSLKALTSGKREGDVFYFEHQDGHWWAHNVVYKVICKGNGSVEVVLDKCGGRPYGLLSSEEQRVFYQRMRNSKTLEDLVKALEKTKVSNGAEDFVFYSGHSHGGGRVPARYTPVER